MPISVCKFCLEPIQETEDAACGWRHTKTGKVICDPTDASPITDASGAVAYMTLPKERTNNAKQ